MKKKLIRVLGILSIAFGTTASILCPLPFQFLVVIAICIGFIGFTCSCSYIVLAKEQEGINGKFHAGNIGLLLNSLPLVYVTMLILLQK